jgi:hypothetical protein
MKFDGNNDSQRRVGVSMLFDGVNMVSKEGRDLCPVIVVVSLSSDDIWYDEAIIHLRWNQLLPKNLRIKIEERCCA